MCSLEEVICRGQSNWERVDKRGVETRGVDEKEADERDGKERCVGTRVLKKRILITGRHSFLGGALQEYLSSFLTEGDLKEGEYETCCVDLRGWDGDASGFDVVYHVAGIASTRGADQETYMRVNCDLAVWVAKRAKACGVGQFIFMSSSFVYGEESLKEAGGVVTRQTRPVPDTDYGRAKLRAEEELRLLGEPSFQVCILRSPMVYGRGCKGNYRRLSALARWTPMFPWIGNQFSMIYAENLMELVRLLIAHGESGTFWPQNPEYGSTCEMVRQIGLAHHHRIWIIKGFGPLLGLLGRVNQTVSQACGSFVYEKSLSAYKDHYQLYGFEESIRRTEGVMGDG